MPSLQVKHNENIHLHLCMMSHQLQRQKTKEMRVVLHLLLLNFSAPTAFIQWDKIFGHSVLLDQLILNNWRYIVEFVRQ